MIEKNEKLLKIRFNYDTLDPRKKQSPKEMADSFVNNLMNLGKDSLIAMDNIFRADTEHELPASIAKKFIDEKIEMYPDFGAATVLDASNKEQLEKCRVFKHRAILV